MDKLFLTVLNMSITGGFVILILCLARYLLKRAPKMISYGLWAIAGIRLLFPFSIESIFSLIPFHAQSIPLDIGSQEIPRFDSGFVFVNHVVSDMLPVATQNRVNPLERWILMGAVVWLLGAFAMLVYGVLSYVSLKRKMKECVETEPGIFETELLTTPFVLGFWNPKVYLPQGLTGEERNYILLHEQTHIRRRDPLIKLAAFFILSLHWFNPLVHLGFFLMELDMEESCDEQVLKGMNAETKRAYSRSLLAFATPYRFQNSPLAFGEGGIKERIRRVLHFKKPTRIALILAVVLALLLSAGLVLNRHQSMKPSPLPSDFSGIFLLESMTDKEKLERLSSLSLDPDGTARLAQPLISSYYPPPCRYELSDDALLILAVIPSPEQEAVFGIEDGSEVARFEIIDRNTIIFRSASVPLYANEGARYTRVDELPPLYPDFEPRVWFDQNLDPEGLWEQDHSLALEAFPDIAFHCDAAILSSTRAGVETELLYGMPIWSVYLVDLNGDQKPELCVQASWGSGIVDTFVSIFDIQNETSYELRDRFSHDYFLSLVNGQLIVSETNYWDQFILRSGPLSIVDNQLQVAWSPVP